MPWWLKLVGLPATVFVGLLAVLGVNNVRDILAKKTEIDDMITVAKKQVNRAVQLDACATKLGTKTEETLRSFDQ